MDIIPVSLGIETVGGVMTRLINKNYTIPTKRIKIFTTSADNQTSVLIRILQVEYDKASENKIIGT